MFLLISVKSHAPTNAGSCTTPDENILDIDGAFSVSASSTWNSLLAHVGSVDKLSTFKCQLSTYKHETRLHTNGWINSETFSSANHTKMDLEDRIPRSRQIASPFPRPLS